jgi:predicted nuclease of predicted toxin-antitoxin system
MRVLLDECVPRPLRKLLPDHQVQTVQDAGWEGKHNGELLVLAEARFDVFITADKNLRYQQKLNARKIGIVELPTNDWSILKQMESVIADALRSLGPNNNYIEIQLPEI